MKSVIMAIILAVLVVPAAAHGRHRHYRYYAHEFHDGRPRAWCGWFMRQVRHVADTSYNLAREWVHYGTNAGGPRIGAVVVWPHHVGELAPGSCPSGEWMVHSGNDGHAERTRCRSLRGAIAFRM
jgi:hypothetical protein